jgi:hypothetical protein
MRDKAEQSHMYAAKINRESAEHIVILDSLVSLK